MKGLSLVRDVRAVKRFWTVFYALLCVAVVSYGIGRLYYRYTDGFRVKNIVSTLAFDSQWEVAPPTETDRHDLDQLLSQPFFYLGKGCQSYAFVSADGKYVLKFFKYQRFQTTIFLDSIAFLPFVNEYRVSKLAQKDERRKTFFSSWVLAFKKLKKECGLIYLHLNKTNHLKKRIQIYDKMGLQHDIDLDQVEFLVQKSAVLLRPYLEQVIAQGEIDKGKELLEAIISMILSEYQRGLADDDHALMQNTGVCEDGTPIHIDVGQFTESASILDPEIAHQELFTKMYHFRTWLHHHSKELAGYLDQRLHEEIGEAFVHMKPKFRPHQN